MATDDPETTFSPWPLARMILCQIFLLAFEISSQIQLALIISNYWVPYGNNKWYFSWFFGNLLLLIAQIWVFYKAFRFCLQRRSRRYELSENTRFAKDEDNLKKNGHILWIIYVILLFAMVAPFLFIFGEELSQSASQFWGPTTAFKSLLYLTAFNSVLLNEAHYCRNLRNKRSSYLGFFIIPIFFNLCDTISFWDVFLDPTVMAKLNENATVKIVVLILIMIFAFVGLIFPAAVFARLRYHQELPECIFLPFRKLYIVLFYVFADLPFLGMRLFLLVEIGIGQVDQVCLLKNALMILLVVKEISFGYVERKRNNRISPTNRVELTDIV